VLATVALLGVFDAEEVAAWADLGDGLNGQGGVVDGDRFKHGGHHGQDVGVDDHLLVGGEQAALQPAGPVEQQVDATHDRSPDGDKALVAGLGVDAVGCVDVRRAVGEGVTAGQLPSHEAGLPVFGGSEGRRPGLHVHI